MSASYERCHTVWLKLGTDAGYQTRAVHIIVNVNVDVKFRTVLIRNRTSHRVCM